MLSIPYELLGNKVAASVELRVRLQKYEVPILAKKLNVSVAHIDLKIRLPPDLSHC